MAEKLSLMIEGRLMPRPAPDLSIHGRVWLAQLLTLALPGASA
jgi:hypothetical protein